MDLVLSDSLEKLEKLSFQRAILYFFWKAMIGIGLLNIRSFYSQPSFYYYSKDNINNVIWPLLTYLFFFFSKNHIQGPRLDFKTVGADFNICTKNCS